MRMSGNRASTASRPHRFVTNFQAVSGVRVTVRVAARGGTGNWTRPTFDGPPPPSLAGHDHW